MAQSTLHTKYRPQKFDEVLGHDAICKSIGQVLRNGTNQAFIFAGIGGTGKTTLARIIGNYLNIPANNITELDAATNSSVDAVREINSTLGFAGFGKTNKRLLIIDEAHALSKSAWQALLKSVEEPPAHIYWAFCTTELDKIPTPIRTRCATYELQPVSRDLIIKVVRDVAAKEDFAVDDGIVALIADQAGGSVREAITSLGAVAHCKDRREAAAILRATIDDTDLGHLMKAMNKGGLTWQRAMDLVKPLLETTDPEGNRRIIQNFFGKVAMGAKNDQEAITALTVLGAFEKPYAPGTGWAPFFLSLGNVIFK